MARTKQNTRPRASTAVVCHRRSHVVQRPTLKGRKAQRKSRATRMILGMGDVELAFPGGTTLWAYKGILMVASPSVLQPMLDCQGSSRLALEDSKEAWEVVLELLYSGALGDPSTSRRLDHASAFQALPVAHKYGMRVVQQRCVEAAVKALRYHTYDKDDKDEEDEEEEEGVSCSDSEDLVEEQVGAGTTRTQQAAAGQGQAEGGAARQQQRQQQQQQGLYASVVKGDNDALVGPRPSEGDGPGHAGVLMAIPKRLMLADQLWRESAWVHGLSAGRCTGAGPCREVMMRMHPGAFFCNRGKAVR
mmetsp:Transcript_9920/g.21181  ORF Transcript_9920/g.21181 Transcript_9920/m.21181 type:complete len:304 (+) Transcript_9920:95-1006(+)